MLQIPGDILKKSLKILYLRFTKLGILIAMMKEDKYAFLKKALLMKTH